MKAYYLTGAIDIGECNRQDPDFYGTCVLYREDLLKALCAKQMA